LREQWGVARQAAKLEQKPIEAKKMRELDNLFGKHLKELENEPSAQTAPKSNAVTEDNPITDDDIPF
jgi:hypothetical protein